MSIKEDIKNSINYMKPGYKYSKEEIINELNNDMEFTKQLIEISLDGSVQKTLCSHEHNARRSFKQ